jgi:hypothetical protein
MFEGIQGMNSLEFPHTSLEGMISLIHYFLNLREYSPVQQEREYSLRHSLSGEGIIFRVYFVRIKSYVIGGVRKPILAMCTARRKIKVEDLT